LFERHVPLCVGLVLMLASGSWAVHTPLSERICFNADWRFAKGDPNGSDGKLSYRNIRDWVLVTGVSFTKDPNFADKKRPADSLSVDVAYTQPRFDDRSWRLVTLPHDWGIEGPFDPRAPGGTGKLPFAGIGWYRKHFTVSADEQGRQFYLDVDGAMSYANVWLNGRYVGGWPYGYASWRVDLTPYVKFRNENVIAIRLDNPPDSSRWYPGGGIYRNVWLTKTNPVHVGHWGTFVTTRAVSPASAAINMEVTIDNDSEADVTVAATTQIYPLDSDGNKIGDAVTTFEPMQTQVAAGKSAKVEGSITLENPRLWGPPPNQTPHRYVAVTTLWHQGKPIDQYETPFGIRSLRFDPGTGICVNGEHIKIKGVNQHHDLGALGAAFNTRAAERQLEILHEMGSNAIRTAHNPPAPELLDLTDRMGFLVVDEIFDAWEREKTPLDFHLIFPDWHEQDLRAMVRRDRNHPSVIMWSFGNEVGEQYTGQQGAAVAQRLHDIVKAEDPTRPSTTAMNWAKPSMPLSKVTDVIGLNYQGEGIRDTAAHAELKGIRTPSQYSAFHMEFPDKVIISSETASALSTRGEYLFPVFGGVSAPVKDGMGGDSKRHYVSAYELHASDFGSSADKVFGAQDKHPYVAGQFVWTGWDHLGEPTPYYSSRSSYCGIIDLAGFKKDRFYLYQSYWRPDLPMAHILPHWTWPQRVGQITPVHVFTSGDEAELLLNGKSMGRKTKGKYEYRLRWDDVKYQPGELKVVAYKEGKEWATDIIRTAGPPGKLMAKADRSTIAADGLDLSFITVAIVDKDDMPVPYAKNQVCLSIKGPGEIVATDNGDPTSLESFKSRQRNAFNGLCLVIVRAKPSQAGTIVIKAESEGLEDTTLTIGSQEQ